MSNHVCAIIYNNYKSNIYIHIILPITLILMQKKYNAGNQPWGNWSYYQLWAKTEWTTYGSFCKDYGFAVLNKNADGRGIGDFLGYFGVYV